MPGPYASTTLVVGLPRNEIGSAAHRRAFPVNGGGAQGAHELENLLQGGYSNSGTSSSETSSFGQRSGVSGVSFASSRPQLFLVATFVFRLETMFVCGGN